MYSRESIEQEHGHLDHLPTHSLNSLLINDLRAIFPTVFEVVKVGVVPLRHTPSRHFSSGTPKCSANACVSPVFHFLTRLS